MKERGSDVFKTSWDIMDEIKAKLTTLGKEGNEILCLLTEYEDLKSDEISLQENVNAEYHSTEYDPTEYDPT